IVFPEAVHTEAEHAYFSLMQLYLTGETSGPIYDDVIASLCDIAAGSTDDLTAQRIQDIAIFAAAGDTYMALSKCRHLLKADGGRDG
ncbi:MAG: flagellar biosynthesis repressor FlbT, partial [Pseudomonadota bacterium]